MKKNIAFIVPVIFFAACSQQKTDNKENESTKKADPNYQTIIAEKAGVATIIKLPAQLAAYQEVNIFPKVNGYVKNVLVDIGYKVKQGNLLMVLEAPELLQATLQAKEKYTRTKSALSIDREHYLRLLEASKTAGAISPFDLSTVKSQVESDSALVNAEKANWEMQQTMMDYLKVTAPFEGVITERNVHPGALVNASSKDKPMLELKQVDHLRLEVDVPEAIAAELKIKDTVSFFVSAFPGKKNIGFVSRKSDNVNTQFRSERIEIDVWNNDGSLSPGMYADIILKAKGNAEAFSVPKSSVVISTERKYVIVLRNGKTEKIDVLTGNETAEKIEVFGSLHVGDSVIVNANDEIK
ncbi:MAG TPA: efflux RND transporter periplasmic adaptor subunit [Chitinophagaceae bacterium]|nr:efflux RND transporter periplasmic adaptor subunit [Chitinophagaceae bacterium]